MIAAPVLLRHILWTQDFRRTLGWQSAPQEHDISMARSSGPLRYGTPSAAVTRWAFSPPNCSHFVFVTQLTLSNYDHFNFNIQDVLKVLNSGPRLEELQLCRVNLIDNAPSRRALVRGPPHMVRSLKRLALEACNITEGLLDAYYDLLFRFRVSLFERIDRLRLVTATVFRPGSLSYSPVFHNLRLPTILHLEAEGFFGYVLVEFFREGYPIFWIEALVRMVSPTLRHFAFRPNLKATSDANYDRRIRYCHDYSAPSSRVAWASDLRQSSRSSANAALSGSWSLGYTRTIRGTYGFSDSASLFRRILDVLPSRLEHLAFVLDLGTVSADVISWATLDSRLSRACVGHGQPLQVRIERYESRDRDRPSERTNYLDQRFWSTRLPTMQHKMLVQDRVRSERLSVERYDAPTGIDQEREGRLAAPGLRSLFDL
ncbi:hypothetical protein LXA43DRAFT_1062833 [Ganoderma leucocontextum]|nr:hypothetical protein LXA43DRAFT_1062833 [Ganoderma leucocontextum]